MVVLKYDKLIGETMINWVQKKLKPVVEEDPKPTKDRDEKLNKNEQNGQLFFNIRITFKSL